MSKAKKVVYLMRGVPGAGKSFAARRLAGKNGSICETDRYFGLPGAEYRFDLKKRPAARMHNMHLFMSYLQRGDTPIVVDRGCGKGRRTWWYIQTAVLYGYGVKFAEPTSPWWKRIKKAIIADRALTAMDYPSDRQQRIQVRLWRCVDLLEKKQMKTHQVTRDCIFKSIMRYDPDLTVEDLIGGHNV